MSRWIPAVRREIHRYRRRTGSDTFSTDELFQQAKPRLKLLFPESTTLRPSLRQTMQTLLDDGEIERREPGQYRISDLDISDVDISGLSDSGVEILDRWGSVVERESDGEFFNFVGEEAHDPEAVSTLVEEFLQTPTEAKFRAFWDELASAGRAGSSTAILEKWDESGKTIPELAELIADIRDATVYNSQWEEILGAQKTLWELYGLLHIEDAPLMTSRTQSGLELFGYPTLNDYDALRARFEDFKLDYLDHCGHRTAGTPHEVPLNIEIDQLFRVIHTISKDRVHESDDPTQVREMYQSVVDQQYEALPAMVRTQPRDVGLHYVLKEIANRYPGELPEDNSERTVSNYPRIQGWFKQEAIPAIEDQIDAADFTLDYSVAEGIGQGYIPHIPYLAVYDDRHTSSTKRGIDVVFLFDPAADDVYLTLNQGAEEATALASCANGVSSYEVLERLATQFADEITDHIASYETGPVPLSRAVDDVDGNQKARRYSKGSICHLRYTQERLSNGEQRDVGDHLTGFLAAYGGTR